MQLELRWSDTGGMIMAHIQNHLISHISDEIPGHIHGLAGYYADPEPNDRTQHVVIAMNNDDHGGTGTLYEIYWNSHTHVTDTVTHDRLLWQFSTIHSLSGFYTSDDNYQHVIVATEDGWLHELYFMVPRHQDVHPRSPLFEYTIPPGPPIGQAGFYTPDGDHFRHATVGGADNLLHEVTWNAQVTPTENILATQFRLQDVAAIAGFFDLWVHSRDVIVAMKGGDIFDVHYGGGIVAGGGSTTERVTRFSSSLINVAAFVSPDTQYRHVIVLDSNGDVYDYSYLPQEGSKRTHLARFTNVADIVGYYSDYDEMRHVIVATSDRNIHEVYYDKVELG
jgi:hypothetical protein